MSSVYQRIRGRLGDEQGEGFAGVIFSLAGDSVRYLLGLVVLGIGNMVLVPLYTRYLSPDAFGVFALLEVTAMGLVALAGMGLGVSYLKWYAEAEPGRLREIYGSAIAATLVVSSIAGTALFALAASAASKRVLGMDAHAFAWLMLPLVALETLQELFLTHFRAQRRPVAYSITCVMRLLFMTGASLFFIAVRGDGLIGVFYGRVTGDAVGAMTSLVLSRRDIALRISGKFLRPMIAYGLPTTVCAVLTMVLEASGRYFVSHYSTLEQVGFYSVGVKLAGVMRLLLVYPFGVAWGGLMFQIAKKDNARLVYSKMFGYLFLLGATAAAALTLFTPLLFAVLATPRYAPAMSVAPLFYLVQACLLLQYPAPIGIYLKSRTHLLTVVSVIGVGANLLLNRMLVPQYAMYGAAMALLLSWVLMIAIMAVISQRMYPLDHDWQPYGIAAGVWAATLALRHVAGRGLAWMSVEALFMAVVAAAIVLYLVHDFRSASLTPPMVVEPELQLTD